MKDRLRGAAVAVAVAASLAFAPAALAQSDVLVTNGSPGSPFSQNKQNEPALAVDAEHPNVLAAGVNEQVDMEACNAGSDRDCPFTAGIGSSGVYFSVDSGRTWTQPTYTGLTARDCLGSAADYPGTADDPDDACTPHVRPIIGTLPHYYENGLVSDGDPAVAFGPRLTNGRFSWGNGSRLYYANLASNLPGTQTFRGVEAIAVSWTDNITTAAAGDDSAWSNPVLVSKQSTTIFSDKEQIWADNAASSPYFGNVYLCNASFRSASRGNGSPEPIILSRSSDGGVTWTTKQISPAGVNPNNPGRDGCTVRTDSTGTVYVFWRGTDQQSKQPFEFMTRSFDGGKHFEHPRPIPQALAIAPGVLEPGLARVVMDGVMGARIDLAPAPSVDIANGAPTGADATDELFMTWADGRLGLNSEIALLTWSTDQGNRWATPRQWQTSGAGVLDAPHDRPFYTAPGVSPDGHDLYLVYNAYGNRYRDDTTSARSEYGVVFHSDIAADGTPGAVTDVHRGPAGDPRGSAQNNLAGEFLGDYVYAVGTRDYGSAVWNDTRYAADCPAIDAYRQAYHDGAAAGRLPPLGEEVGPEEEAPPDESATPPTPPDVQGQCSEPLNPQPGGSPFFGNSDIFGISVADPTTP
jgi:hypothetical protein